MFNIVIFGPPGAGKGTQSDKIIDKYNFHHISTGDMFRGHIQDKTELGKEVINYLNNGLLVPDDVTIKMLEEKVNSEKENVNGFIFDGFPRTVPQAEALDAYLQGTGYKIDLVLQLDVTEEEIKKRIEERAKISGRADDNAEKLIQRINEYFNKTIHVLPYYENQGKVVKIQGLGKIEDIFNNISNAIDNAMKA